MSDTPATSEQAAVGHWPHRHDDHATDAAWEMLRIDVDHSPDEYRAAIRELCRQRRERAIEHNELVDAYKDVYDRLTIVERSYGGDCG